MKTPSSTDGLAYSLGEEAYQQTLERAKDLCAWEKLRIKKDNEADSTALRARLGCLNEERERLRLTIRQLPSGPGNSAAFTRGYLWSVFALLWLAGFLFAYVSLEPFGLGWPTYLISLAVAVVAPVSVDFVLVHFESHRIIRIASLFAVSTSLAGLFILALLRGDVVLLHLKTALAGSMPGEPTAHSAVSFYEETASYLKWLFALLTVGMELAAGMCLHEARKLATGAQGEWNKASKQLRAVEDEMTGLLRELVRLENDPEVFEAGFMRDFHRGLLDRIERNGRNGFWCAALLIVSLFSPVPASAQLRMKLPWAKAEAAPPSYHVLVGVDLSQSVAGSGYDGATEHQKNISALVRLAAELPAGTRLTAAAITSHSFAKPFVLLSRALPRDPGPLRFLNRIEIHQRKIAAEIAEFSTSLAPEFPETDVFGLLVLGAQIFEQSPENEKILVVFSDMRHSAPVVNLERQGQINASEALQIVERHQLLADLVGVDVYVFGAHGNGRTVAYWESLRAFWEEYFRRSRARLKAYSATREIAIPFKTHEPEREE